MSTGGFVVVVWLSSRINHHFLNNAGLEPTTAGVPNHCSPLDAGISTVEGVSQGDSASLLWGKPILGQT